MCTSDFFQRVMSCQQCLVQSSRPASLQTRSAALKVHTNMQRGGRQMDRFGGHTGIHTRREKNCNRGLVGTHVNGARINTASPNTRSTLDVACCHPVDAPSLQSSGWRTCGAPFTREIQLGVSDLPTPTRSRTLLETLLTRFPTDSLRIMFVTARCRAWIQAKNLSQLAQNAEGLGWHFEDPVLQKQWKGGRVPWKDLHVCTHSHSSLSCGPANPAHCHVRAHSAKLIFDLADAHAHNTLDRTF